MVKQNRRRMNGAVLLAAFMSRGVGRASRKMAARHDNGVWAARENSSTLLCAPRRTRRSNSGIGVEAKGGGGWRCCCGACLPGGNINGGAWRAVAPSACIRAYHQNDVAIGRTAAAASAALCLATRTPGAAHAALCIAVSNALLHAPSARAPPLACASCAIMPRPAQAKKS
jgi:hypothetical protein